MVISKTPKLRQLFSSCHSEKCDASEHTILTQSQYPDIRPTSPSTTPNYRTPDGGRGMEVSNFFDIGLSRTGSLAKLQPVSLSNSLICICKLSLVLEHLIELRFYFKKKQRTINDKNKAIAISSEKSSELYRYFQLYVPYLPHPTN